MKTKVQAHEGVTIYRVNVRGQTFYKSDLVYGEAILGNTIDEVAKKITTKCVTGDTRVQALIYEGVNIYRVSEGSQTYFLSDRIYDETITGETIDDVKLQITRKHAMVGGF